MKVIFGQAIFNRAIFNRAIFGRATRASFLGLGMVAILVALLHANAGLSVAEVQRYAKGRIIVQARAGVSDAKLDAKLAKHQAKRIKKIGKLRAQTVAVKANEEAKIVKLLKSDPLVEFAELDVLTAPSETIPNDPYYSSAWHLTNMHAPQAWDISRGAGVVVAVLDSGVDSNHPDLLGKVLPGYNSVSNNTDSSPCNGHGTLVAGTIAASSNNGIGVASLAWDAMILPVRITNDPAGYAYWSDIAAGLNWATNNGAKVANISYQASESATIAAAADALWAKGGMVVSSAGNDNTQPAYGDVRSIITVAATASGDTRASFSNYGNAVDVSAPGSNVWTTVAGGTYKGASGTSFSSPATAAVAALVFATRSNLSPQDVEYIIEQSAVDLGTAGWDMYYGYGRVDALNAVTLAQNWVSRDTTPPTASFVSPASGATVKGTISVEVGASDNVGVASVELKAGGVVIGSTTSSPYLFSLDTTTRADGTLVLTATVRDTSGNVSSPVSRSVNVRNTVDTTAPTVRFINPTDASTVTGVVNIQVSASDNIGVSSTQVILGSKVLCSTSSGSLSCNWNTKRVKAGSYILTAKATDASGNTATTSVTVRK